LVRTSQHMGQRENCANEVLKLICPKERCLNMWSTKLVGRPDCIYWSKAPNLYKNFYWLDFDQKSIPRSMFVNLLGIIQVSDAVHAIINALRTPHSGSSYLSAYQVVCRSHLLHLGPTVLQPLWLPSRSWLLCL